MSREEWVADALELLWGEFRHDTKRHVASLRASYYTDRDRVRWALEDAAEKYLRGELSSIHQDPVYPAEVVREAARKYAAGEVASWAAEAESPVYQVDSNPA